MHPLTPDPPRSPSFPARTLLLLAGLLTIVGLAAAQTPSRPSATFQRGVNTAHFTAIIPAQHPFGDPLRLNDRDLAWIAAQGFDHIRLPVDGERIADASGRLDPDRLRPINRIIAVARDLGLGVILSLHRTTGADCADLQNGALIYERSELADRFIQLWRDLATAYIEVGPGLRFELLNEPIAPDHEAINRLHRALIAAIRTVDPDRVLIIDTNRWAEPENLEHLDLPADDPHLIASVHYYKPFAFTHQGTSWTELGQYGVTGIPFPGVMPDVSARVPAGHWLATSAGEVFDAAAIRRDMAAVAAWARTHQREVYVGELGAYSAADPASRRAWYTAVVSALEAEALPWAVWEYNHHFGVRNFDTGQPTLVLEALTPFLRRTADTVQTAAP